MCRTLCTGEWRQGGQVRMEVMLLMLAPCRGFFFVRQRMEVRGFDRQAPSAVWGGLAA